MLSRAEHVKRRAGLTCLGLETPGSQFSGDLMMIRTRGRHASVILLLLPVLGVFASAQKPTPPPKKNPLLKLAEPWPDAEQLKQRKATAEALPLFAKSDTLTFTLAGDFKSVNKDHDPNSAMRYPAELRVARDNGGPIDTLAVKLGARGHVRRMARTCDYVPLRIEFEKDKLKGTVFEGQSALKLVVQCAGGGDFEQYVHREYLAYKIYNLISPRSMRARLAKVNYVDPAGKPVGSRVGMLLEDDGDVAKRMEGRTVKLRRVVFDDVDRDTLLNTMIFEYMIGNTDVSIFALHNLVLVQTQTPPPDKNLYTVPYDFDISGLVHPPYAIPDRQLAIRSVQDRLYRGPCLPQQLVDPIVANFVAKKDQIMALPAAIPEMDKSSRDDVKSYLESFYSSIKNSKDVKRLFSDCKAKPTM
jgi:hypothetical protein